MEIRFNNTTVTYHFKKIALLKAAVVLLFTPVEWTGPCC